MNTRHLPLWADVALTLASVTFVTILLSAGIAWLAMRKVQLDERIIVTEKIASYIAISAEQRWNTEDPNIPELISHFKDPDLHFTELWIVDQSMKVLAQAEGQPPRVMDSGLRTAFFKRETYSDVVGLLSSNQKVVVTWPISPSGPTVAAVRVSTPVGVGSLIESRIGFLALYVLFTSVIMTIAGFILLRKRLVQPIEILQSGTKRISTGDFSFRVELEAADELMSLNKSLNEMAASLEDYKKRTTEQVRSLEESNTALEKAQENLIRSAKLASVGRLAAGIAHEVGNPLAVVMGYVDLVRSSDDPVLKADLMERTAKEVQRIHLIIKDLLDYARPSVNEGYADLTVVLSDSKETMLYQPAFRKIQLKLNVEPNLPRVKISPEKLRQVVINLLLNAADAISDEGHVFLGAGIEHKQIVIYVEDDGCGLTEDIKSQLFEPFFTTKAPGAGLGLGLATSQSIVESAGGTMTVKPLEKGTRFEIRFPMESKS